MADEWWRHLTGKPFYWVLDEAHPAASYFLLRHVVERPDEARGLKAARLALLEAPEVEALKARLAKPSDMIWTPRYSTPFWSLRLLAELGVPGDDERIATALDHLLDQPEDRDFEPMPVNLNALILHIALAFGFHEDERVQGRLARLQNDLEEHHNLPDSPQALADWLTLAAMALAALPTSQRDAEIVQLLERHLTIVTPKMADRFEKYGFPTFDQPDDLTLGVAALQLGLAREWLQPWVQRIEKAQDEAGLWRMDRLLPPPVKIPWETRGEPSRWLSAKAMYVLREFYGE